MYNTLLLLRWFWQIGTVATFIFSLSYNKLAEISALARYVVVLILQLPIDLEV
jgi:uncharacterized integral membrane protein